MKKFFLVALAAISLASCTTTTKTARVESIPYTMFNANVADLQVADRVTYTYTPDKAVRRAGLPNCKMAAISKVLSDNGNADLLVEPQFVVSKRTNFWGTKITSVTVSGRPAKYVNIHSLSDDIWKDPVFRGVKNLNYNVHKGGACPACPHAPQK